MSNSNNDNINKMVIGGLVDTLQSMLLGSDNLRETEAVIDLVGKCKESNIDASHIVDVTEDNMDEVKEVASLARSAVQGRDEFFSALATKMVGKIVEKMGPQILDLTMDQITIKTKDGVRGVQVSIPLFTTTKSPYIQCSLALAPKPAPRKKLLRVSFQIKVSGKISDLGIMIEKGSKKVSGKLDYIIEGSIVKFETPFGAIPVNIELAKKEFQTDLVNFNLN